MQSATQTLSCVFCGHSAPITHLGMGAALTRTPSAEAQAALDADLITDQNRGDGVLTGVCFNQRACGVRHAALLAEDAE